MCEDPASTLAHQLRRHFTRDVGIYKSRKPASLDGNGAAMRNVRLCSAIYSSITRKKAPVWFAPLFVFGGAPLPPSTTASALPAESGKGRSDAVCAYQSANWQLAGLISDLRILSHSTATRQPEKMAYLVLRIRKQLPFFTESSPSQLVQECHSTQRSSLRLRMRPSFVGTLHKIATTRV